MTCDQCASKMANVGRQIKPGDSAIWMDGYVCHTKRCPGYGSTDFRGSVSRWPAMTLMEGEVHARIRGAMKFRDSR